MNRLLREIVVGIIAGLAVLVIQCGVGKIIAYINRWNPRKRPIVFHSLWILWLVINITTYFIAAYYKLPQVSFIVTLLVSSAVLYYGVHREISQFWNVGLRGADQETRFGIDYTRCLQLVQNQFSFLGIGASKLTKLDEFEHALTRCRKDMPIRFLLLRPTDDNLTAAASQFGRDRDEYKERVLASLRHIADIKRTRKLPIQIRFYPEPRKDKPTIVPLFRLAFIDDSLCLMSYNVFGEGDGSQLPQLHLVPAKHDDKASGSFYYAMERYYEYLWEQADPWDFKEFIINNE